MLMLVAATASNAPMVINRPATAAPAATVMVVSSFAVTVAIDVFSSCSA